MASESVKVVCLEAPLTLDGVRSGGDAGMIYTYRTEPHLSKSNCELLKEELHAARFQIARSGKGKREYVRSVKVERQLAITCLPCAGCCQDEITC